MSKSGIEVEGKVLKEEKGDVYSVELGNGFIVHAKRAGRLTLHKIRVISGDRVLVELSPYDLTRGRITYRFRD